MQNLYTPTEFEDRRREFRGLCRRTRLSTLARDLPRTRRRCSSTATPRFPGPSIELTDGGTNEAGSAFYTSPVNIQTFTTDFTFQLTNANADGFTFTIQNGAPAHSAHPAVRLGYAGIGQQRGGQVRPLPKAGDGPTTRPASMSMGPRRICRAIDLTSSGINLHSGDKMDAHIAYDGTTLTLTITDLVTMATFSHPFTINIPAAVGANTAYIGFTGGTGGTDRRSSKSSVGAISPGKRLNNPPAFLSASGPDRQRQRLAFRNVPGIDQWRT